MCYGNVEDANAIKYQNVGGPSVIKYQNPREQATPITFRMGVQGIFKLTYSILLERISFIFRTGNFLLAHSNFLEQRHHVVPQNKLNEVILLC